MATMSRCRVLGAVLCLVLCLLLSLGEACAFTEPASKQQEEYIPPELQASDPQVKSYIDASYKLAQQANYAEAFQQLQKALDFCSRKGLVADQALLEAKIAGAYFVQGKLEESKQHWGAAYSDALKTQNLVLQADTLVALSSMSGTTTIAGKRATCCISPGSRQPMLRSWMTQSSWRSHRVSWRFSMRTISLFCWHPPGWDKNICRKAR